MSKNVKRPQPRPQPAQAFLHHRTPGRARFRVPSRHGDTAYFGRLEEALHACPAVTAVSTNPATAGILVHHTGDLHTVTSYARSHSLFALAGAVPIVPLGRRLSRQFGGLDKSLLKSTGGAVDLSGVVFLSLLGVGVAELLRGELVRAIALFSHAGVALLVGRPTEAVATEAREIAALLEGD
jgi:hypothetical protein